MKNLVARVPASSQAAGAPLSEAPAGSARRPRLTLWQGIRRYPLAVILPAAIGLAAGIAIAASRPPVYTAKAVLAIEQVNANTPGALAGYATAAPQLAEAYGRAIVAESVVADIGRRTGATPTQIHGRITANPVPSTPVLFVQARGPTSDGAIAMANAGSRALVTYVAALNQRTPVSDSLFAQYQSAQVSLQKALARRDAADEKYAETKSKASLKAFIRARADVAAAQLEVDTLGANYRTSRQSQAAANPLHLLAPATKAADDQRPKIQLLGFLGLLAGSVVGLALAVLLGSRAVRRAWS
jgi:hypothetical protein